MDQNQEIPESLKNLRAFYDSPIYQKASWCSEQILRSWQLLDLAHGKRSEERKRILCACRAELKKDPSYFDFSYAVGRIHHAVATVCLPQTGSDPSAPPALLPFPAEQDGPYLFLRAAAADVLLHFPGEIKELHAKDQLFQREFAETDLYLFHWAIALAACKCFAYLDIHEPDHSPMPRYLPPFLGGPQ